MSYTDQIAEEYNQLRGKLDEKTFKNLHLNSVGNIIFYFQELDESNQKKVYDKLKSYFLLINKNVIDENEKHEKDYYYKHLEGVIDIYIKEVEFTYESDLLTDFIVKGIALAICFFIKSIVLTVIVGGYICWQMWLYNKQKQKRRFFKFGW